MFGVPRTIYLLTLGQDIAILKVNATHTAYSHSKILPPNGLPTIGVPPNGQSTLFLYKIKIVYFKMRNGEFVQLFFCF